MARSLNFIPSFRNIEGNSIVSLIYCLSVYCLSVCSHEFICSAVGIEMLLKSHRSAVMELVLVSHTTAVQKYCGNLVKPNLGFSLWFELLLAFSVQGTGRNNNFRNCFIKCNLGLYKYNEFHIFLVYKNKCLDFF